MSTRTDRNERLFGTEGQRKIANVRVVIVGTGGLGAPVAQQLGYLGVKRCGVVDSDRLDVTSLNRHVGSGEHDVDARKVNLIARMLHTIDASIEVETVFAPLISKDAFDLVKRADWVFGCLDNDAARLVLNELCIAYDIKLIDLATDVPEGAPRAFGGRFVVVDRGYGCLVCRDIIDTVEAARILEGGEQDRRRIYGIGVDALDGPGPSVVSINGLIASAAVNEFMCAVTGLRAVRPTFMYRDDFAKITRLAAPKANDCMVCARRGLRENGGVERHLR